MRITAGIAGGRTLRVPPRGVRPTQDMVRQALFSSLGEGVAGCRFLDLYAGSGAVGLEAWSRGAAFVCWVESDPRTAAMLQQNVKALGVPEVAGCCMQADCDKFLARPPRFQALFDVAFADPPYARDTSQSAARKTLLALAANPILRPGGLMVFEQGSQESVQAVEGWTLLKDRRYGEARLVFYRIADAKKGPDHQDE